MSRGLPVQMLVGLVVGAAAGVVAHLAGGDSIELAAFVRYVTEPIGKIFLRLLFVLVIPLVVSALALGVAGLGNLRELARIGLRTLGYTIALSSVAVALGVSLVNLLQPGRGGTAASAARAAGDALVAPAPSPSGVDFFVGLVPQNPVKAMAEGEMLAVMVFALLLGIGLVLTRTEPARRFEETLQGLYDVVMRLLELVIRIGPVAVGCLLFTLTARFGWGLLVDLGAYVFVVLLGLGIQMFVVYSLTVRWLGGMSPRQFFRAVRAAMITAFATASSNATLPTSLAVAEHELGLPREVSRFVLTIGSTANQNGTALFEGVTVLFLAQLYGVDLGLGEQLLVAAVCILGGIGTAGVPAGSIPVVATILGLVGVPPEAIGIVLGVDRLLDMCRTTLNVTGDLATAVVVARAEQTPDSVPAG